MVGPGRYLISGASGVRVSAVGETGLKVGDPVRVLPSPSATQAVDPLSEPGQPWTAFIPLGFGGAKAAARLKVYVEKQRLSVKSGSAVYLVLECETELQRMTQWSLYLRGRSVAIQVFPGEGVEPSDSLLGSISEVEENLKKKGFFLTSPTVILKRKFSVPRGFHLNVRG